MTSCSRCDGCVESECDPGYYGDTCELNCNMNCRALPCLACTCGVCDKTSGNCSNGCDAGWYGSMCEEICPENCFRENLFSVQCEQNVGGCRFGCAEGFYGDKCNTTCSTNCVKSLCQQTNGACAQGCIHGFKGEFCTDEADDFRTDQVAGAVGGAFVVILWGVIVIILICVIWRKRLKDYEVFNRNRPLTSNRTSSRRHLRRQSSNLSAHGMENQPMADNHFDNYEISMHDRPRQHAFRHSRRSLGHIPDGPHICCENHASMELHEHTDHDHTDALMARIPEREFYVQFVDDDGRRQELLVKQPSDEDLSEISEVWKPRKY